MRGSIIAFAVAIATLAVGPQVGGFGFGGNPRPASSSPMLEVAPASGAGLGNVCACGAVTGSKGEAFFLTRAGTATCTKTATGGFSTTGIADGDLVSCAVDKPRVEFDSQGFKGLRLEEASTNSILRSEELDNVAWTAVATVTGNVANGPFGTLTADQLNDVSAVAQQGVSQSVSTTSQTQSTVACYVKAGTASSAQVSLTGTGNTAGDCFGVSTTLSASTWTRIQCTSPVAYGVGITAKSISVVVGNVASVTGTILVGGCDLIDVYTAQPPYIPSYVPTTSAAVTRPADTTPDFPLAVTASSGFSVAASVNGPLTQTAARLHGTPGDGAPGTAAGSAVYVDSFLNGGNWNTETSFTTPVGAPAMPFTLTGQDRALTWSSTTQIRGCINATCSSIQTLSAYTPPTFTRFRVGQYVSTNGQVNGIVSRVCFDATPARCR